MDNKLFIAGPCSAETREQVLETAKGVSETGIKIFRCGLWKPRSRIHQFEGVGEKALPWLNEVQQIYGMEVAVEVALPAHVEACLKAGINRLWIGARTTPCPFLVQQLADCLRGVAIPVLIKNPVCPDLELWIGAIERFESAGITDLTMIHRGFCTIDAQPYRNNPVWGMVAMLHAHYPQYLLLCDPSHIAGDKAYLYEICQQALKQDCNGFFIESHCCPSQALSDTKQQITPAELGHLLNNLALYNQK